ncbi:P-loop NTPase [Candidatus Magnetomonas plexicatena]|uniref:P-loop NTPase n=1 Tax=Candidatus Magnetomonas plexicatena TaxID=2552947 RepID=UPI001C755B4E|nr:MinD/ParA family protein [Nitrospirales bacterium LBB_01]
MKLDRKAKHVLAIAGGKGGVGKSVFSITLATLLSGMDNSVCLVDLDLGGANLHTYLGVMGKTMSLAHFIQKKVKTLQDVVTETRVKNLSLISGVHYLPSMSNPASTVKAKLLKHIRALDVDFVIIDLGAGMDLSTMDFFINSDKGFIVTVPEPGAIMNAYRFIKGALYRKLRGVFKNHAELAPVIDSMTETSTYDDSLMLNLFIEKVLNTDPEVYPLVMEVSESFAPFLVLNRIGQEESSRLVTSLINHCFTKYGVKLNYVGNIPDVREISAYLLDIPSFLQTKSGAAFTSSVKSIVRTFLLSLHDSKVITERLQIRSEYNDSEIEELSRIIDKLNSDIFIGSSKKLWKLRLFFKPLDVVRFLIGKGVKEEIFFEVKQGAFLGV